MQFPVQQRLYVLIGILYHLNVAVHARLRLTDAIEDPGHINLFHILFLVLATLGPGVGKISFVISIRFDLIALFLVELGEVEGGVSLALVVGVVLS